jgi:hypothetical protein
MTEWLYRLNLEIEKDFKMSESTNYDRDLDIIEDLKTLELTKIAKKYGLSVQRVRAIDRKNREVNKKTRSFGTKEARQPH